MCRRNARDGCPFFPGQPSFCLRQAIGSGWQGPPIKEQRRPHSINRCRPDLKTRAERKFIEVEPPTGEQPSRLHGVGITISWQQKARPGRGRTGRASCNNTADDHRGQSIGTVYKQAGGRRLLSWVRSLSLFPCCCGPAADRLGQGCCQIGTRGKSLRFYGIVSSPKPVPNPNIFRFTRILIYVKHSPSPRHHEGRFAVVTKRGAGCDGT